MATRKSPASAEKKTTTRKAPAKKSAAAVEPAAVDAIVMDSVVAKHNPTYEDIAILAEQFWQERGRPFGTPEVDWLRAEATLYVA